jgi:hypothetical protein
MRVLLFACLLVLAVSSSEAGAAAQDEGGQTPKPLTLRGAVQSVQVKKDASSAAFIAVKLKMELVNTGFRPIIFLNRNPLFPGGRLAEKPEYFGTKNILAKTYGGPSNDISPEWSTLRSSLDEPGPPPGETRTLMPGDSWPLDAAVVFVVPTATIREGNILFDSTKSLPVIQGLSPAWLRVDCEVWPFNVESPAPEPERSKFKFGHELQKRWNDFGLLWLSRINSEPIMLDLKKVK